MHRAGEGGLEGGVGHGGGHGGGERGAPDAALRAGQAPEAPLGDVAGRARARTTMSQVAAHCNHFSNDSNNNNNNRHDSAEEAVLAAAATIYR